MLLCAGNGVVDLRTGSSFRAGRRNDRITMATAVPYDPKTQRARGGRGSWSRCSTTIRRTSLSISCTVRSATALTGEIDEQCLFLLGMAPVPTARRRCSPTLNRTLGDYVYNMPFSTVDDVPAILHPELMWPRSLAVGVVVGIGDYRWCANQRVPNQGATRDAIRSRLDSCIKSSSTFEPVAKFMARGQSQAGGARRLPRVLAPHHGLFPSRNDHPTQDLDLADELQAEREGILAWAVRGCLAWQRTRAWSPPTS